MGEGETYAFPTESRALGCDDFGGGADRILDREESSLTDHLGANTAVGENF